MIIRNSVLGKAMLLSASLFVIGGCSTNGGSRGSDTTSGKTENIQLDTAGVQGEWKLTSYRVQGVSAEFEATSGYNLSFNEPDNTFGMTTDCNSLGGEFEITNDTIRFMNIAVTAMACDKMIVEENMLRLFNDTTGYAVRHGDSIRFVAPAIGDATFVKL